MPVSTAQNQPMRYRYKLEAINKFSAEAVNFLNTYRRSNPSLSLTLVPIPPSKSRSDPEYDDRMEQVANKIAGLLDWVVCLPILSMNKSMESYHSRSGGRNPDEIYDLLEFNENLTNLYQENSVIALIDDVLTSGAHFEASRRCIQEYFPHVIVIGIFWAKAISPEPPRSLAL